MQILIQLRRSLVAAAAFSVLVAPVQARAQDAPKDPKAEAEAAKKAAEEEAKKKQKERDEAIKALLEKFAKARPDEKGLILEEFGKIPDLKVVQFLQSQVTGYSSQVPAITAGVRQAAAKALWGQHEKANPSIARAAVKALTAATEERWNRKEKEGDGVMRVAIEGLGELRDPSAAKFLIETVDHANTYWAESAIAALEKLRVKEAIEPIIKQWLYADNEGRKSNANDAMKERRNVIGSAAGRALAAITGQNFEKPLEWQKWWGKAKGTFVIPKLPGDEEGGDSAGSNG